MKPNGRERRITCLTGTPGTGKSTLARMLQDQGLNVLEIETFCRIRGIYSYIENGETLVIDESQLAHALDAFLGGEVNLILVGHLSHNLTEPTSVIVLRTRPSVLERRLASKGWPSRKISENVEAEALDIILSEALRMHGPKVSEIDTTNMSPEEAVNMVISVHESGARYPPEARDWLLEHILKERRTI